jgi:hypothetical protein
MSAIAYFVRIPRALAAVDFMLEIVVEITS